MPLNSSDVTDIVSYLSLACKNSGNSSSCTGYFQPLGWYSRFPPPPKKKIPGSKINSQKIPCQFPSLKIFQKAKQVLLYLIRRTRQRGYTSTIVNPHKEMVNVQRATMELRTHAGGCQARKKRKSRTRR